MPAPHEHPQQLPRLLPVPAANPRRHPSATPASPNVSAGDPASRLRRGPHEQPGQPTTCRTVVPIRRLHREPRQVVECVVHPPAGPSPAPRSPPPSRSAPRSHHGTERTGVPPEVTRSTANPSGSNQEGHAMPPRSYIGPAAWLASNKEVTSILVVHSRGEDDPGSAGHRAATRARRATRHSCGRSNYSEGAGAG